MGGIIANILKFMISRPLLTAGIAGTADLATTGGDTIKSLFQSIVTPAFDGVSNMGSDLWNKFETALNDGSLKDWVVNNPLMSGVVALGTYMLLPASVRNVALVGAGGYMAYKMGLFSAFTGAASKDSPQQTMQLNQPLTLSFAKPGLSNGPQ